VRCPLGKMIYMLYAWATKRSQSMAITDISIGKKWVLIYTNGARICAHGV